jgi:hypothetical protein
MGRRIASESKQTVRGGPKPAKVGLHRRLVKEWMNYECSGEGTCTQNIHNSSTRSHPSEDENRARNRSKN